MPTPIKNFTATHTVVPPMKGQDYHAVVHGDSGREVVRCATYADAVKEQSRLNALDRK